MPDSDLRSPQLTDSSASALTGQILALASRSADEAEALAVEANQTVVEFKAGELVSSRTSFSSEWGLRVIRSNRLGFASTTGGARPDQLSLAAVEAAEIGPAAYFSFPDRVAPTPVKTLDNRVLYIPPARLVEWGRDIVAAFRARVGDVKLDLSFTREFQETTLGNSHGLEASFQRAKLELRARGQLAAGPDRPFPILEYLNLSSGQPLEMEPLLDRLERAALTAARPASVAAGAYPVMLMPRALRRLVFALVQHTCVAQDGRLAPSATGTFQKVLGDALTIVDNPLRDYGTASRPFDAEGSASRPNILFEDGVFEGPLLDLATADYLGRRFGLKHHSTGSASRAIAGPPRPGPSNLEVKTGEFHYEAALDHVHQGLVILDLPSLRTSEWGDAPAGVVCGLSLNCGEISGRVSGIAAIDSVSHLLEHVVAVGSVQQDLGDFAGPFAVVEEADVIAWS